LRLKVCPHWPKSAAAGRTTIIEIGENCHAVGIDNHTAASAFSFKSYYIPALGGLPGLEIVFPHNSLNRAPE
jgi:hypothetical protein